jgi:putative membrane protein (TIGR04086 family)
MEMAHPSRKKRERSFLQAVLLSLAITALSLLSLLLLASALLLKTDNPLALIPACGNGCALFCAFLCGYLAARLRGRQGLIVGAAAGLGYLLVYLLVATVLVGEGNLEIGMLLFSCLFFLALAVLGGMLGSLKRERRRRRRKRV